MRQRLLRPLLTLSVLAATTLVVYAAASYPSSVKSFTTKLAGQTVASAHINEIQDEIVAVEGALLNGFAHALKPSSDGAQDLGTTSLRWGTVLANGVRLTDATTLTLATDAATVTHSYHALDTEGAAGTDNCATLTAGSGVGAGFLLVVRAANVAHVVTMKDGTGNLLLNGDYALSTTDATMTLIYDGTNWRELARSGASLSILDRQVATVDVVNTTTETALYTKTVTGGTLSTNKGLRLTVTGDYLNNSGGAVNFTLRVKYGATTLFTTTSNQATGATRAAWQATVVLSAANLTNAQVSRTNVELNGAAAGATTVGTAVTTNYFFAVNNGIAEDSTADKTFQVTAQHATAAATISARALHAVLEYY